MLISITDSLVEARNDLYAISVDAGVVISASCEPGVVSFEVSW